MKKRNWLGLAALLLAAGFYCMGRRPLSNLTAGEVAAAEAGLYPPGRERVLTREEIEALVPLLNQVTVYRRDGSVGAYSGQAAVFTLTLTDGSRVTVQAYNPFAIINGTGWRTKRGPCEALNRFAIGLF